MRIRCCRLASPGPGTLISRYRLIEPRGRGGMGEVWLAEDTQLPRNVAVKLLPPHLAQDDDAVQRLVREADATARIDHPAVATVYQAGEHLRTATKNLPSFISDWPRHDPDLAQIRELAEFKRIFEPA